MKATPQLNLQEIVTLLLDINPDFAIPMDDHLQSVSHLSQQNSQASVLREPSERGSPTYPGLDR